MDRSLRIIFIVLLLLWTEFRSKWNSCDYNASVQRFTEHFAFSSCHKIWAVHFSEAWNSSCLSIPRMQAYFSILWEIKSNWGIVLNFFLQYRLIDRFILYLCHFDSSGHNYAENKILPIISPLFIGFKIIANFLAAIEFWRCIILRRESVFGGHFLAHMTTF